MYVQSFETACNKGIFMLPLQLFLQKVRDIKHLPVDMKAIMEGLSSLMVPSQKPMFSPHMYAFTMLTLLFSLP